MVPTKLPVYIPIIRIVTLMATYPNKSMKTAETQIKMARIIEV